MYDNLVTLKSNSPQVCKIAELLGSMKTIDGIKLRSNMIFLKEIFSLKMFFLIFSSENYILRILTFK